MRIKASVIVILIFALLFIYVNRQQKPQVDEETEEFHIHAGFKVYKDNELVDFSGLEYMKINPCLTGDGHAENEDEQIEKAHLHDNVGDVAHVHRENATWADLFMNIGYPIMGNEDLLASPIKAYESVVFFEGENSDIESKASSKVSREHILEVEGKSENCGS